MAYAVYRPEKSNLDAISLSNCPKLSDNQKIKTVEYAVAGASVVNVGLGNGRHIYSENSLLFDLVSGMELLPMKRSSGCYTETIYL